MNIVITGGAGFLGQRLADRILKKGSLVGRDGREAEVRKVSLVDVVAANDFGDKRVQSIVGDVADSQLLREVIRPDTDSVFHLAAIVSGQAEADFDLGMRINLDASRALLDTCRANGNRPTVVFSSSVAVYGGKLPTIVRDDTALSPRTSYGVQKAIGELLVNEYSRRGFVDGRVLRLPTISVRPGKPNKAASSFASGIIREPLNGDEAICPVSAQARLWLLSPRKVIDCLVRSQELPAEALADSRIINLPGISVSVADMVAALERVGGKEAVGRIRWEPDPMVERMVSSWPAAWDDSRARKLGFEPDVDFESIIRAYIEDDRMAAP